MKVLVILFLVSILSLSWDVLAEMKYPYIASSERSDFIKSNFKNIEIGDTESVVISKLNEPDEIHNLFEPKKYKPKIIGKTYWYIIRRISDTGSVNNKDEIIVRITFNLNNLVTKVEKWGF